MSEVFYWLVNMTVTASAAGLIVLLVRRIKGVPRWVVGLAWLIVLFRCAVPVSFSSDLSAASLLRRAGVRTVTVIENSKTVTVKETADGDLSLINVDGMGKINSIGIAESYRPFSLKKTTVMPAADGIEEVKYETDALEKTFNVAGTVWVAVFCGIIISYAALYAVTMRALKDAQPCGNGIYRSDRVDSPAVYGIFKPRIVLPASWEADGNGWALIHERTHVRRADNLKRVIAFTAAALHWFNPLSWVMLNRYLADLELSCDAAVLRTRGEDRAKEYAAALVECAEKKTVFASAFGGERLKLRVKGILNYKKLSAASTAVLAILAAAVTFALIGN